MPLNMVSMAIYVTLEGKIPRTPIYCIFTYISLIRRPLQFWQSLIMCVLITLIVILGTSLASPRNGVFVWSFALPILYYLLLGKQYGVIFSAKWCNFLCKFISYPSVYFRE